MAYSRAVKRAALSLLPLLPLDILCEILGFLHPSDLFIIGRTSKLFLSFLLKKQSAFIWRSARRNIDGLPEPPPDMSEVQYASLVFGSACHYEGCDKKARDTVWHLRIRSCASCRSKYQPVDVHENQDVLAVCTKLACFPDTLEQYIPCGPFLNSRGKSVKGFQEAQIKTFRDDLDALDPSEYKAYLDQHEQLTALISQFAQTGVAWQRSVKNVRIVEMHSKRMARAEVIRDILAESGFKREIDYFGWDRIRKHPLINSTQPLTDKARSGALDQLREYMLGWRELWMELQVYTSRREEFVRAWRRFASTTTFHNALEGSFCFPLPPSATVGSFENIDSIIRQSEILSEPLFDQLHDAFSLIGKFILDWHKSVRRELAGLLPDYKADMDDEATHTQLKLATSVFHCRAGPRCRSEGRPLTYPEVLYHPCFTQGNGLSSKDPRGIAKQKACLAMGANTWSCKDRIQVHPNRSVVNKVLQCCEKDPRCTTAAEMDRQDPRLACVECHARDRVIISMTWRRAILHSMQFHPKCTLDHPWIMACQAVHERITMHEPRLFRPFPNALGVSLSDYSVCLHCPPRIPSWNTRFGTRDLMSHLRDMHDISNPVLGEDYAFDQNITPVYLDPVIVKRKE